MGQHGHSSCLDLTYWEIKGQPEVPEARLHVRVQEQVHSFYIHMRAHCTLMQCCSLCYKEEPLAIKILAVFSCCW